MKAERGFTIIEVLIATIILAALIGALVSPLGGLFRMTKDSQRLLDNTTLAQQVVERISREWQDADKFSRSCLDQSNPLPAGVTVEVTDLNPDATPAAPAYSLHSCTGAADSVLLKRVKVTAGGGGRKPAEIVLDIARPQS